MKGGYSCQWKCIVTANCKWSGSFGGMSTRTIQGIGNAEICLPDDDDVKFILVTKYVKDGTLTIQIVGPDHVGQQVMTDAAYGAVTANANMPDFDSIDVENKKRLEQIIQ